LAGETASSEPTPDRPEPEAAAPVASKARLGWRVWAVLLALYAVTRLVGLTALPAFLDESWHASWAMHIAEGQRLDRPWHYGKGLSVFANALVFPWAASHWLWASRCVTVVLSLVGLWGCVETARLLFGRTAGLIAGIYYGLCPFLVFHERLVLTDPVMAAFGAALLALSVRLGQAPSVGRGLAAALALTLVLFSKATGLALAFVPLAAVALLQPRPWRAWRALLAAYAPPLVLTTWPLVRFLQTSPTMRVGLAEGEPASAARLAENVPLLAQWLGSYLTLPLLLLAAAGLVCCALRRERGGLLLAAAALLPLAGFVSVAQLWFPRYVVFAAVPLLVLAAGALACGARALGARRGPGLERAALVAGLVLSLAAALRFDYALWTDPRRAPLPATDRFQFVDGWPSGYGIIDTIAFVKQELERQPQGLTLVLHSHSQRTLAFAVGVAFRYEPRVQVADLPLGGAGAVATLESFVARGPTVVVVSSPRPAAPRPDPRLWAHLGPVALVTRKPDGRVCDWVFRLCGRPACP
jgi:4-amino-4-deoxy-L-arabinose transferase-like glycosyltransferase